AGSIVTEGFCKELLAKNKQVYTFDGQKNQNIIGLGARSDLNFVNPSSTTWDGTAESTMKY
ncbi:MAG: hypothetical protein AAB151_01660, partial [Nitrospirota bacterium]